MVATLPAQPYITAMIPVGFTDDGNMTFGMTGFFAEVFDNLQVAVLMKGDANLTFGIIDAHLTGFIFHCRAS